MAMRQAADLTDEEAEQCILDFNDWDAAGAPESGPLHDRVLKWNISVLAYEELSARWRARWQQEFVEEIGWI